MNVPQEQLADFFQRVDRIVSSIKFLKVKVDKCGNAAIGCSFKNTILINFDNIELLARKQNRSLKSDIFFDFIKAVKGVNYHELGHVLFTEMEKFNSSIEDSIFNAIEDGRIETLFSSLYPKARKYFVDSYMTLLFAPFKSELILNDGDFLITWSRREFIDSKIVNNVVARYRKPEKTVNQLKKLIDEFVVCPKKKRRREIAIEITEILQKENSGLTRCSDMNNPISKGEDLSKSNKSVSKNRTKKAIKLVKQKDISKVKPAEIEDVTKLQQEIKEEFEDQIEKEIKTDMKALSAGSKDITEIKGKENFPKELKDQSAKNMLTRKLKMIKDSEDMSWSTRKKNGKIDAKKVHRIIQGDYKVFKKWKNSDLDKFKKDVCFILDVSGSMSKYANFVLKTGWAIGESLRETNLGHSEIIQFSDTFNVIKRFDQSTYKYNLISSYGTVASFPVEKAKNDLEKCPHKKYLFIMTDMEWHDLKSTVRVLHDIDKKGISITILAPDSKEDSLSEERLKKHGPNNMHIAYFKSSKPESMSELIKKRLNV